MEAQCGSIEPFSLLQGFDEGCDVTFIGLEIGAERNIGIAFDGGHVPETERVSALRRAMPPLSLSLSPRDTFMQLIRASLLLTLVSSLGAQDSRAWREFTAVQGPDWRAEWCPATGTPLAVFGPGLRVSATSVGDLATARLHGYRLLEQFSDLLGRGTSTFVEDIATRVNGVWVLVFAQRFRGLEVTGGHADVRLHNNGVVSMFGSHAVPIPDDFATIPRVSPDAALLAALAHHGLAAPDTRSPLAHHGLDTVDARSQLIHRAPELVIEADVDAAAPVEPRLAWKVLIHRPEAKIAGATFVDARTGAIIRHRNGYHECAFSGFRAPHAHRESPAETKVEVRHLIGPVMPANVIKGKVLVWANRGLRPADRLTNLAAGNIRVRDNFGNWAYADINGNFTLNTGRNGGQTINVEFWGRHVSNVVTSQGKKLIKSVTAFPNRNVTIQIYTSGASRHDRAQSTTYWCTNDINEYFRSIPDQVPPQMNVIDRMTARVNIKSSCNAYYVSNTINFFDAAGGCANTAYSTVNYHEWGHGLDDVLGGISQIHGLSEGWGDIVATYRTGQPVVGHNFRGSGFIRTALNTRTYPPSGGVHQQGEVWMGFAWDVRTNLIKSLGRTQGPERAEKIVLGSIVANARNQPAAVREVFLFDDDDGNLNNGTPNYAALEAAALKRKLPYPKRTTGSNPGTFGTFGTACMGTGKKPPSYCLRINETGKINGSWSTYNQELLLEMTAQQDMTFNSFELKLKPYQSSNVTVRTWVYDTDSQGHPYRAIAGSTLKVGTTEAFYKTLLRSSVTFKSGKRFFIGFTNPGKSIYLGSMSSGMRVRSWRKRSFPSGWTSNSSSAWGIRIQCAGGGGGIEPKIGANGRPEIGRSFDLTLTAAASRVDAALLVGLSDRQWGSVPLPFDLGLFGAPGCSILVAGDIYLPLRVSSSGSATFRIPVPNTKSIVGKSFFTQFMILDRKANQLGIVTTQGGRGKIGMPL